jgi:hypothetical protein
MSDFLVSPSQETAWSIDPEEFEEQLRERWPDAEVWPGDPDSQRALTFELPSVGDVPPRGRLMRDGQVVGLDGDVPESAEVASWFREVVPAQQELVFWDQGYSFHVPLTEGITRDEIVAAVEAGDS